MISLITLASLPGEKEAAGADGDGDSDPAHSNGPFACLAICASPLGGGSGDGGARGCGACRLLEGVRKKL
jgi:hypothetical protein